METQELCLNFIIILETISKGFAFGSVHSGSYEWEKLCSGIYPTPPHDVSLNMSLLKCAMRCSTGSICKAFFYTTDTMQCRLQDSIYQDPSNLQASPSTDYYVMAENGHNIAYHTESSVYEYLPDMHIDVPEIQSIVFSVKACNDAYILLSESKDDENPDGIQIALGGWHNSRSGIKDCRFCGWSVYHEATALSCDEFKPFWIRWSNIEISVGKGTDVGESQIMSRLTQKKVNHIAITTTDTRKAGEWTFPIYLRNIDPDKLATGPGLSCLRKTTKVGYAAIRVKRTTYTAVGIELSSQAI